MRRPGQLLLCLSILLSSSVALAQDETSEAAETSQTTDLVPEDDAEQLRIQGVELRLLPIFARSISLDYERWIAERFSLQGGVGLRISAMGDYSGTAATLSLGARYWLHEWGPSWMSAPLGGFFLEAMTDFQRTTVHDEVSDEDLPSTYTLALVPGAGFRVAIFNRVTITLTAGFSSRVDIPRGPLRAQARIFQLRYGMRAGVLF